MSDLRNVRRFPDTCDEAVSRGGEDMPCEKPAVAARYHEGRPYAVCAYHTRGAELVPLRELLSVDEAAALDVLRAAGWTVEFAFGEYGQEIVPGRAPFGKRTVARSPWREVSES